MGCGHEVATMRRIAVDWDGTLAEEVWPGIGDWKPGAKTALHILSDAYDEVVIFTLRVAPVDVDEVTPRDSIDQIMLINAMLEEAHIPENVYVWLKPYKPPCETFIDDRAVTFNGYWPDVLKEIGLGCT